jgi:hypothetical protein
MFLSACSAPAMGPFTAADPGQFEFYSCEQLATARPSLKAHEQELKLLMDKAAQSTGGTVVNVIAYKAEYVTATEQLKVLEPIREVWTHGEAFAASRLSMMRIMARRMNAATVVA